MSVTFYPGNRKIIAVARQTNQDTPAAAPTEAWRVTGWTKNPVRVQSALEETDSSAQQGATSVTSIGPSFACDFYLRFSEFDLVAEMLLGANVNSASGAAFEHVATPNQEGDWWTVWEIEPGVYANRYDGVRVVQATIASQDDGDTRWKITGFTCEALGFTAGGAEPAFTLVDEEPAIWAETNVIYNGVYMKTTSAFTLTVNRNARRAQGDAGFRAIGIVKGKLQVTGTTTRYVQNDDTMRSVDTGSPTGTVPTATVYTESVRCLIRRSASRFVDLILTEVAYPTREQALQLDGQPLAEALGFETQPQADIANNVIITTCNSKATVD